MEPIQYLIEHTDPIVGLGILFLLDRFRRLAHDLRQHMKEEKDWREEYDHWRIEHLTGHVFEESR